MKEMIDFEVVQQQPLGSDFFRLVLHHPHAIQPIFAGQFVEVRIDHEPQVMLRRPISVCDYDPSKNLLTLLVKIVGKGTQRLSLLSVGNRVNILYPLGNGFSLPESADHKVLLVGGGVGIAPLLYLAKTLKTRGITPNIIIGGRSCEQVLLQDELALYGDVHVCTDDGSLGHHGLVTDHPLFSQSFHRIFCCGPTPMMKAVARSASSRGIDCEVSLENMMACGLGACLCCVVDSDSGHRCVCKEGPVFNIKDMTKWYNQ